MGASEIRQAQRAQPLRPFTVHLADGRQFFIQHPEFIFVSHNERMIVIDDVDGNVEIIDPMLVTSLSIPAVQQP